VILSILIHLYKSSRPHVAVVGRVPGTQHFRNVERHKVETDPEPILTLRVDESLYFANARYLEDKVYDMVASVRARARHLDVPGGQRDRHERAGIAGGDQRAAESAQCQIPSQRNQGAGDGPARPATSSSSHRQGVPEPASGDL
jgi:hypothetical protein